MTPPLQPIGVAGAGTMGLGLAQLCVRKGLKVVVFEPIFEALKRGRELLALDLSRAAKKGRMTPAEAEAALKAAEFSESPASLSGCPFIIEAVPEDLRLKRRVLAELGSRAPTATLATNTSSLSVMAVASDTPNPYRVIGMHFFNPPMVMKLVEVISGDATDPERIAHAMELARFLGKTPVMAKDTPGFIVNRVMRPYYVQGLAEAAGGAGIAAVDRACKELGKVPMGPLELMDLIGLDVNLSISRAVFEALGRPERLRPNAVQEELVRNGCFGRKTSKGFYLYDGIRANGINPSAAALLPEKEAEPAAAIWRRIQGALIKEAAAARDEGVAAEGDIDTAVKLAMNFPKGPFEWQKENASTP